MPYGWNLKTWTDKARALVAAGEIGRIEYAVLQMASALEIPAGAHTAFGVQVSTHPGNSQSSRFRRSGRDQSRVTPQGGPIDAPSEPDGIARSPWAKAR